MSKKKLIIFGAGNADVICSTINDIDENIEVLGFLMT